MQKLLALAGLALFTIPVTAGPLVYVITGSQEFGEMDLATGAFSSIGPIPATIQYLVSGTTGSLLTMSFDGNLNSINPSTGALSVIGATGFSDCSTPITPTCGPNSQLSFGRAGGTLYATDFANNLYTINSASGKATLVGSTGIPAIPFIPASTNPDGSFNFYDENLFDAGGKLYANFDAATFNPATSENTIAVSPALYQIDTNTGAATKVADTDLGLITILNSNGTIYGFNGVTSQVEMLDVLSGKTSVVSDIDPALGLIGGAAAVAVPEPGPIALTAVGIVAIAVSTLRRRSASLQKGSLRDQCRASGSSV
jgi:hypothetical protein